MATASDPLLARLELNVADGERAGALRGAAESLPGGHRECLRPWAAGTPALNSGDCWRCSGFALNAEDGEREVTLGELLRILSHPDELARLIQENMPWAAIIALKVSRTLPPSFDISDLEQEAYIAVWRAAEKFDASKGVPFRGYAYMAVRGAVLMACRRRSYTAATADELAADYVDSRPSVEQELLERRERKIRGARDSKRRRRTVGLMDRLPYFEQFLIKRVYLDGDDVVELAAAWSMDAGLLKKRLRGGVRMMMKLRVKS